MDNPQLALKEIVDDAAARPIPKGQSLLRRGEAFENIYILRYGVIKMMADTDQNVQVLHLLRPFALMPFAFFSPPGVITRWEYVTQTDCSISALSAGALRERLLSNGKLAVSLASWFSLEVHELLLRLNSLGKSGTREKMVAAFQFLQVHYTHPALEEWAAVLFPVTHQFIADMTGVAREGITKNMAFFEANKLIRSKAKSRLEINTRILEL